LLRKGGKRRHRVRKKRLSVLLKARKKGGGQYWEKKLGLERVRKCACVEGQDFGNKGDDLNAIGLRSCEEVYKPP